MWNSTVAERNRVANRIAARNHHTVQKVWPLVTGLWFEYSDTHGNVIKVSDYMFKCEAAAMDREDRGDRARRDVAGYIAEQREAGLWDNS